MAPTQPWVAHWPPRAVEAKATSHGCPAGSKLWSMGSSVSNPKDKETSLPQDTKAKEDKAECIVELEAG
ncbi:unnamed protein product [Clonostachys rosea f. rosea IK726]|uniref:Uncharacterized protein n=2 Tax=Bionectria ochroleuca TaxID=29856 RepID=A0A0B7K707_BIOOC|nr:unnamed protein product [Clonostachys rosea f. rosea IK726]